MPATPWIDAAARKASMTAAERREIARMLAQYDRAERNISRAVVDAIVALQQRIDVREISRLLRAGDVAAAIRIVSEAQAAAGLAPIVATATDQVVAAGRAAVAASLTGHEVTFAITNPRTVAYLQASEFRLIRELTDTLRGAVAHVVRTGVEQGRNPLDVARDVRDVGLTLTERQASYVLNYRRQLETGSLDALARELRDRRFDRAVQRAAESGKPLSAEQIDKMVERYRQRWIKHRAQTIARTESLRAVNAGNRLAWKQAVDAGTVAEDEVVRKWIFTHDSRTRDAHRAIPGMNAEGVGLDEPFKTPDGPMMEPGDPSAPARATINCRCTTIIRTSLARAIAGAQPRPEPPSPPLAAPAAAPETPAPRPSLGVRRRRAQQEAEATIRRLGAETGVEHLRWVDLATGELVDDVNSGDRGFVGITPRLKAAIEDPKRRAEVHHNHPSDSSFSRQDIHMLEAYPGLASVFAHGALGSRYQATNALQGAHVAMNAARQVPLSNAALSLLGGANGLRVYAHATSTAVSQNGWFEYTFTLADDLDALLKREDVRRIFTGLVDEMTGRARRPAGKAAGNEPPPAFIDPPWPTAGVDEWREFLASLLRARAAGMPRLGPHIAEAEAAIASLERAAQG